VSEFRDLAPCDRLLLVEAHQRERPDDDLSFPLAPSTLAHLERVKVALVSDLEEGELEDVRADWLEHLDALDEVHAEEAERRVVSFLRYLDGLVPSDPFPEEEDALNVGDAAS
jgi:hypothetical protein